jgi:Arc/MetJ family transcription regulator
MKKTTIELPDELADEARRCAAQWGTTMRSLIEDALRRELERRSQTAQWHPRPELVFVGDGLTQEAAHLSWSQIRELANER